MRVEGGRGLAHDDLNEEERQGRQNEVIVMGNDVEGERGSLENGYVESGREMKQSLSKGARFRRLRSIARAGESSSTPS